MQENLPQALPSLRNTQNIVRSGYKTINEGKFRFNELAAHITSQQKAPNTVTIGEDATRVVSRVKFDAQTNCCVGFVLLLIKSSGVFPRLIHFWS